jgi:hypothetical protein
LNKNKIELYIKQNFLEEEKIDIIEPNILEEGKIDIIEPNIIEQELNCNKVKIDILIS